MVQIVIHEVKKKTTSEDTGYRITGDRNSDCYVANAGHARHVLFASFAHILGPIEPK